MTAVAKETAKSKAVLKEDSAEAIDTGDGSDDGCCKGNSRNRSISQIGFSEEIETDDGSGETKEVDLTAVAKETTETEAVLKEDSSEEIDLVVGLVKQRRLI